MDVKLSPTRKWAEVIGFKSFGSLDNCVSGLEFQHVSICVKKLYNASYVNIVLPITLMIFLFIDLTPASHNPSW